MDIEFLGQLLAFSGIAAFIITMIEIPFWFVYSGVPPKKNVITRTFISLFVLPAILLFSASLALYTLDALAIMGAVFTVVIVAVTYVSHSLQLGSVLAAKKPIDPTLVGSGGEGSLLIYGPITHLLFGLTLILFSTALMGSGHIPDWVSALGYAFSVVQLLLVPTIFSKTLPEKFYSLNGWNIPVSGGLFTTWILIVSLCFLLT